MACTVEYGLDHIRVVDKQKEIVYWDKQEWIEDPDVVFAIANAIDLCSRNPNELKKRLGIKE